MANLHTPKLSAAFVKTAPAGKYTNGHGLMLRFDGERATGQFVNALNGRI